MITADGPKLARAISNVVKNAILYANPATCVEVICALEGEWATISVSDEGVTIEADHLTRVFERFYREDDARSTERGGAGMGLAIAKEIVEAHGGIVSVASDDEATTFMLAIPTSPKVGIT